MGRYVGNAARFQWGTDELHSQMRSNWVIGMDIPAAPILDIQGRAQQWSLFGAEHVQELVLDSWFDDDFDIPANTERRPLAVYQVDGPRPVALIPNASLKAHRIQPARRAMLRHTFVLGPTGEAEGDGAQIYWNSHSLGGGGYDLTTSGGVGEGADRWTIPRIDISTPDYVTDGLFVMWRTTEISGTWRISIQRVTLARAPGDPPSAEPHIETRHLLESVMLNSVGIGTDRIAYNSATSRYFSLFIESISAFGGHRLVGDVYLARLNGDLETS